MSKNFLKGCYYIPKDDNENPYSILKNANKNKLNFIIIEYTNKFLFTPSMDNRFSKLLYVQDKIESFEKKYKNTIGLICFKCHSIIGPIRVLLSKSIFKSEVFKLRNFHLWCYLNNPTLILSYNNYTHIENDNIKRYFTIYNDNFSKSISNYITILNKGMTLTPMYINNGFIYIKNENTDPLDFKNLKEYIGKKIKGGEFYTSTSDKFYLNYSIKKNEEDNKRLLALNIDINNNSLLNHELSLINNKEETILNQNLYNLKKVSYNVDIKNNANKFLILKVSSKNNLFALTSPIYINF